MGSDNMTEAQAEIRQPSDAVPSVEVEAGSAQPGGTVESEVYVEVEGDSQTPNQMSERQKHAAWKEEKRKRKEAQQKAWEKEQELERLKQKLEEVERTVGNVARGKRPDPYDFDDVDDFYKAWDKWQSVDQKPSKPRSEQQQGANNFALTDDQEWHYEKTKSELSSKLPDFDQTEERVRRMLKERSGVDTAFDALIAISHTYDIDFAKAMYALDKLPAKLDDIFNNAQNPALIGRVLRDLESKVKVRDNKPIDTKPEPSISGGGQLDNHAARIEQARKAYAAEPSVKNWNALQAAKKK